MSFHGIPIAKWWDSISIKYKIGSGKSSTAYVVYDNGIQYIVRTTPVFDFMQRKLIQHERTIYNKLMQHPKHKDYISELLFSYCPTHISAKNSENLAFFIFQFTMGMPLDTFLEYLKNTGLQINPSLIPKWRTQLREALDFLDTLQIVHRDLKPSNLYIDSEMDRLLLFDFELACRTSEDECRTTDFRGTRNYATPEALALLHSIGWRNPYTYTRIDDEYAIETMFTKDILPLTSR